MSPFLSILGPVFEVFKIPWYENFGRVFFVINFSAATKTPSDRSETLDSSTCTRLEIGCIFSIPMNLNRLIQAQCYHLLSRSATSNLEYTFVSGSQELEGLAG